MKKVLTIFLLLILIMALFNIDNDLSIYDRFEYIAKIWGDDGSFGSLSNVKGSLDSFPDLSSLESWDLIKGVFVWLGQLITLLYHVISFIIMSLINLIRSLLVLVFGIGYENYAITLNSLGGAF